LRAGDRIAGKIASEQFIFGLRYFKQPNGSAFAVVALSWIMNAIKEDLLCRPSTVR
jgi:hypothetical protein